MATYREMQDRINLDYLNRTDLQNETKRAIIRAVKHYEKERFWFNMTATALAIGVTSATVAVPADFIALDFATVRDSSKDYLLTIRSFDRIAYKNIDTATSGIPAEICYWQEALKFTPKPSSATTLTVHYVHTLPALSADSDTNGWTSAGEDLIVHHATADLLANVLRITDKGVIESHKQWEMEAYRTLQFGNKMRLSPTRDGAMQGSLHGAPGKVPVLGEPFPAKE